MRKLSVLIILLVFLGSCSQTHTESNTATPALNTNNKNIIDPVELEILPIDSQPLPVVVPENLIGHEILTIGSQGFSQKARTGNKDEDEDESVCGDGVVEGDEDCESSFEPTVSGNDGSDLVCDENCHFVIVESECGNGIPEAGEECDPVVTENAIDIGEGTICSNCHIKEANCIDGDDNDNDGDADEDDADCLFMAFVSLETFSADFKHGLTPAEGGVGEVDFPIPSSCSTQISPMLASGGQKIADCICQHLADNSSTTSPYNKNFIAWLSTAANSATSAGRVVPVMPAKPYFGVDLATKIADDHADLVDFMVDYLDNPISINQNGTSMNMSNTSTVLVWTGTSASGSTLSQNCDDWRSTMIGDTPGGFVGDLTQLSDTWTKTSGDARSCDSFFHLYCFEID